MLSLIPIVMAVAAQPAPPVTIIPPPVPTLKPDQQLALDCAVTFGLVAKRQRDGAVGADKWPPIGARHREFFVRLSGRLIDEYGIGRMQVAALVKRSVDRFAAEPAAVDAGMPGCQSLLDAAGL